MTVYQALTALYGPIPEGATCHIGTNRQYEGTTIEQAIYDDGKISVGYGDRWEESSADGVEGPPICPRPAYEFRGFFGPDFDALVLNAGEYA